uniref:Uncharacterized protein n=1 Tax=Trichuris muris TaxID=70415 RepID=A0A5S6Q8C6_TRIMR
MRHVLMAARSPDAANDSTSNHEPSAFQNYGIPTLAIDELRSARGAAANGKIKKQMVETRSPAGPAETEGFPAQKARVTPAQRNRNPSAFSWISRITRDAAEATFHRSGTAQWRAESSYWYLRMGKAKRVKQVERDFTIHEHTLRVALGAGTQNPRGKQSTDWCATFDRDRRCDYLAASPLATLIEAPSFGHGQPAIISSLPGCPITALKHPQFG